MTFGARPGDVAAVQQMGLDKWIDLQLHPERIPDKAADDVLSHLEITNKSALELFADHPLPNEYGLTIGKGIDTADIRRKAAEGMMSAKDSASLNAKVQQGVDRATQILRLAQTRAAVARELPPSILIHAVASDRQLLEVMTAFWENHFSVAAEKMPGPFTLVEYDRTIRAHALGKFRDLLEAVAKSPRCSSISTTGRASSTALHPNRRRVRDRIATRVSANPPIGDRSTRYRQGRGGLGVNENYARELHGAAHTRRRRRLHAEGRAGSGALLSPAGRSITPQIAGAFLFRPQLHDAGEKIVLGHVFAADAASRTAKQVLDILSRHPSTAHFIARKLARHFVSDIRAAGARERCAQTFSRTDGDIRETMRMHRDVAGILSAARAYRAKVKTPFELVASIARAMARRPDTTARNAADRRAARPADLRPSHARRLARSTATRG